MPFGTGAGVAVFFELFLQLLLEELNIWKNSSFLILALLVIPYFSFFSWIEDNRLFHKQFRNVFKVDLNTMDISKRIPDEIMVGGSDTDGSVDFKSNDKSIT